LILIVVGIVLAVVVVTKPVTNLQDIPNAVWTPILSLDPANPSVLSPASEPYNSAGPWGYGPMPVGGSLALNILASGSVRVTVASVTSEQTLDFVFDDVGTSFFESVAASGGTYQVQITNEGATSVEIMSGSNVTAQQRVTTYETSYPYVSWGSLVAALGVVLVVVGYISKPKKRLSKR
jgi:hypothetical protein